MLFAAPLIGLVLFADGGASPVVLRAPDRTAGAVSPGEIVIVRAAGLGPPALLGDQLDAAGRVMTTLAGTRVLFDDVAAPLAYSVAGETMAVVPYEVAGRKFTEVVVEHAGKRSQAATVEVADATPALFTLDSTGRGQAAMLNELGCCNSARNPAPKGTVAVLYATGEGQTNPPGISGGVAFHSRISDYPVPRLPVQVSVGGKRAEILYGAEAPHAVAGLLQVNFRIPRDAPVGDAVPLTLSIGNWRSPEGVTMAVRSAVQRVVVVEPDAGYREHLSVVLTQAHYYVSTAGNPQEAIVQATKNLYPVDLILFSVSLPETDRIEAMRVIRSRWPQVKVIAAATSVDAAALRTADLMGAQAVLARPLAAAVLVQKVSQLLHAKAVPYVN